MPVTTVPGSMLVALARPPVAPSQMFGARCSEPGVRSRVFGVGVLGGRLAERCFRALTWGRALY
jgi:hypothetical protein